MFLSSTAHLYMFTWAISGKVWAHIIKVYYFVHFIGIFDN